MTGIAGKALLLAAILFSGGVLSMVVGGFVFGFVQAGTTGNPGSEIFDRIFIGVVFAFLTSLSGGYPPENEGGSEPSYNV